MPNATPKVRAYAICVLAPGISPPAAAAPDAESMSAAAKEPDVTPPELDASGARPQ